PISGRPGPRRRPRLGRVRRRQRGRRRARCGVLDGRTGRDRRPGPPRDRRDRTGQPGLELRQADHRQRRASRAGRRGLIREPGDLPMTRKFLVVVDDSPEFGAALKYAARRARATGGRVALLRVIPPAAFEHWSGAREEIERQLRDEAESLLRKLGEEAAELSGSQPLFLIEQ